MLLCLQQVYPVFCLFFLIPMWILKTKIMEVIVLHLIQVNCFWYCFNCILISGLFLKIKSLLGPLTLQLLSLSVSLFAT